MKLTLIAIPLAVIFGFFASQPLQARPTNKSQLNQFDIKKEPQRSDWQYFHNAPERFRYDLWRYHRKQGRTLASWSWGWRLGWIRGCAKSTKKYCHVILNRALTDDALVVRAEAATVLGRRYEKTANRHAIVALTKAYQQEANYRNGRPLFVVNRILFALHQIGGTDALAVGSKLAASHPHSRDYWNRVVR